MTNLELAKWYAAAVGVVLVIVGLLGFIDNPIVGDPAAANPVFHTGAVHNVVHIASGAALLFVAFGLTGANLTSGLIVFGVAYGAVLVLALISPTMFGLFQVSVNLADHVLHAALAVLSVAVGWLARSNPEQQAIGS
ncbi:MAG: DUF4383 domain-containing protein [Chloroflexota bacterium]|nr:DUF4383 domain-containing protein [Chloroflexota bacterium]